MEGFGPDTSGSRTPNIWTLQAINDSALQAKSARCVQFQEEEKNGSYWIE